jgi:hypothetical protein
MLLTYCLASIVHFPMRSQGLSSTAIDNIFIDTNQLLNYTVSPLYNGLADHDAQLLILNYIHLQWKSHCTYTIRSINTYSVEEFITKLSYESWGNIFNHTGNLDVDTLFNVFLSDYLRLFYSSFPICKKTKRSNNNPWMTPGIRISCKQKRYLYLLTKNSNDGSLKNHYKQYCKILTTVIREAKRCMYNNQLTTSTNKIKTTWNIIKAETNRSKGPLNTDTILKTPPRIITDIFYLYLKVLLRV